MSENTKEALKHAITDIVEAYDQCLPFVGPIMDIKTIDAFEKRTIDILVDALWNAAFKESTDQTPDDVCFWTA
jgi:hypothetical protein